MIGLSPWEQAEAEAQAHALILQGGQTCTVTRQTGRGQNTSTNTQTAVPYWRDDSQRARLAAMAGGDQSASPETLYFLADANVQADDVLTDGALRFTVEGTGKMTQGAVLTVYATRRSGA